MKRIPTITQGCDFTFRIAARRIGFNNFVKVSFEEIANITVNLIELPSRKTPLSYSIDEEGRILIPVDGTNLECTTYGVELIGFYNNGNWRHQIAPAVEIVKVSAQDNYALTESDDRTIDLYISLGDTSVSTRLLDTKIEEHNTNTQAHQDLRQEINDLAEDGLEMAGRMASAEESISDINEALQYMQGDISEAGKVDDVTVNGQSVLNQITKTANITMPTKVSDLENDENFANTNDIANLQSQLDAQVEINDELREGIEAAGKVDEVTVNGQSVLDQQTKTANITMPTKVSDLQNDNNYQSAEEVAQAVSNKQSQITIEGETLIF